jgi:hypothetical protein
MQRIRWFLNRGFPLYMSIYQSFCFSFLRILSLFISASMPIHTGKTNPTAIPHPGYQCLIVLFSEKISVGVYRASHLSCGACRNRWYDLFPIVWQGPVMDYYCSLIYTGYRCCNKDSADLPGLSFPMKSIMGIFTMFCC